MCYQTTPGNLLNNIPHTKHIPNMKANKEWSQYLTAQAEKLAFEAYEIATRYDLSDGKECATMDQYNTLLERAKLITSNAQNKTEAKRLEKIMRDPIWCVRHSIA